MVHFVQVSRLEEENRKLEQTIRHMIRDIEACTVSKVPGLCWASMVLNVIYSHHF